MQARKPLVQLDRSPRSPGQREDPRVGPSWRRLIAVLLGPVAVVIAVLSTLLALSSTPSSTQKLGHRGNHAVLLTGTYVGVSFLAPMFLQMTQSANLLSGSLTIASGVPNSPSERTVGLVTGTLTGTTIHLTSPTLEISLKGSLSGSSIFAEVGAGGSFVVPIVFQKGSLAAFRYVVAASEMSENATSDLVDAMSAARESIYSLKRAYSGGGDTPPFGTPTFSELIPEYTWTTSTCVTTQNGTVFSLHGH